MGRPGKSCSENIGEPTLATRLRQLDNHQINQIEEEGYNRLFKLKRPQTTLRMVSTRRTPTKPTSSLERLLRLAQNLKMSFSKEVVLFTVCSTHDDMYFGTSVECTLLKKMHIS